MTVLVGLSCTKSKRKSKFLFASTKAEVPANRRVVKWQAWAALGCHGNKTKTGLVVFFGVFGVAPHSAGGGVEEEWSGDVRAIVRA